jgi:hypothetical protein
MNGTEQQQQKPQQLRLPDCLIDDGWWLVAEKARPSGVVVPFRATGKPPDARKAR